LKTGVYTLEVEYINNTHVADFALGFQKYHKKFSLSEISQKLSETQKKGTEIWYVGVYESGNANNDVILQIPKKSTSISLLLQSYSPVHWIIENPSSTKIESIVYG